MREINKFTESVKDIPFFENLAENFRAVSSIGGRSVEKERSCFQLPKCLLILLMLSFTNITKMIV